MIGIAHLGRQDLSDYLKDKKNRKTMNKSWMNSQILSLDYRNNIHDNLIENQISADCRFIENIQPIAELMISPYLTISQLLRILKFWRSVGDISASAKDRETTIYGIVNIIRKTLKLTS